MRLLVYGDIGGSGGYVRYCQGLFGGGHVPPGWEVVFVCSPEFRSRLRPLDSQVQVVTHPWMGSRRRWQRYLWHLLVYPMLVRRLKPDAEFYPLGRLRVFGRRAASVVTCHNLLLYSQEEVARFADPVLARIFQRERSRQERSFLQAGGVIFLSDHSRDVVLNEVPGVRASDVIPLGRNGPHFAAPARDYALGKRVTVLYVSHLYPYKNPETVVKALAQIRRRTGLDIVLRFVGGGEPGTLSRLQEIIKAEGAGDCVFFAGELDDAGLAEEYRNANLFVFASSCECFPNILLEAMSSALPIACSNRAGLPAIAGDAALYFDPFEADALAAVLERMLGSEEERRKLGLAASRRAAEFSWAETARRTFAFIRTVSAG